MYRIGYSILISINTKNKEQSLNDKTVVCGLDFVLYVLCLLISTREFLGGTIVCPLSVNFLVALLYVCYFVCFFLSSSQSSSVSVSCKTTRAFTLSCLHTLLVIVFTTIFSQNLQTEIRLLINFHHGAVHWRTIPFSWLRAAKFGQMEKKPWNQARLLIL